MTFDDKPKRAPPKNIGQKPPKKNTGDDVSMNDETPPPKKDPAPAAKPAPARAAAPSSDKPKPSAPTKGPVAPIINDEDMEKGCSKEEALERVSEYFSADTVAKFDGDKWNVKVEGFTEL